MIYKFEIVKEDNISLEQNAKSCSSLSFMQYFEFLFISILMRNVLRITHDLSQVLQRIYQDIVNAMKLVTTSKWRLHTMMVSGWYCFLNNVSLLCEKYNVLIPNMNDTFQIQRRSRHIMEKFFKDKYTFLSLNLLSTDS